MNDPTDNEACPRLILLKQWFDPEQTIKGLGFARRLQQLGFDVEVVTGFPNYPGGRVFPGYRIRPIQRELMEGVAVTRLALYPSHDRSRVGRVLNYVSFFLSATLYLVFFARRANVVYAYHPPLLVGTAAVIARYVRRMPLVLDIQDMWPDTLRATGMINNAAALRVIGGLCRWTWRGADRITVLSEGFRSLLVDRGVAAERITVIPNWADEDLIGQKETVPPAAFAEPGRFRVLFAGNMGAAQGLDSVLDAAALVAAKRPDIEFCFLGSGIVLDRLKARVIAEGLANVSFLPRVPMAEVSNWLQAADCLLVHLKADPLFSITIPSKTQAYMAAAKPILMAVEGDAADLVRQAQAGATVAPENPRALASAIIDLAEMDSSELARLGANGRRFYDENLCFERGTRMLASVLHAAMSESSNRNGVG